MSSGSGWRRSPHAPDSPHPQRGRNHHALGRPSPCPLPRGEREKPLPDGDGDAGRRTRDAVDDAEGVGDEAADGVERLPFDDGDEVVGAGHGVHRRHAGARAFDLRERLLDLLGLPGCRFDQHVGFHVLPPCAFLIESRSATAAAPMPAAMGQKFVRKNGIAKNGERPREAGWVLSRSPRTSSIASSMRTVSVALANSGSASAGCPTYPWPPFLNG